MVKIEDAVGKTVKFSTMDGEVSIYCRGNGTIYEDVNNYYCVPNFYNMNATGVYSKSEYTMRIFK